MVLVLNKDVLPRFLTDEQGETFSPGMREEGKGGGQGRRWVTL